MAIFINRGNRNDPHHREIFYSMPSFVSFAGYFHHLTTSNEAEITCCWSNEYSSSVFIELEKNWINIDALAIGQHCPLQPASTKRKKATIFSLNIHRTVHRDLVELVFFSYQNLLRSRCLAGWSFFRRSFEYFHPTDEQRKRTNALRNRNCSVTFHFVSPSNIYFSFPRFSSFSFSLFVSVQLTHSVNPSGRNRNLLSTDGLRRSLPLEWTTITFADGFSSNYLCLDARFWSKIFRESRMIQLSSFTLEFNKIRIGSKKSLHQLFW